MVVTALQCKTGWQNFKMMFMALRLWVTSCIPLEQILGPARSWFQVETICGTIHGSSGRKIRKLQLFPSILPPSQGREAANIFVLVDSFYKMNAWPFLLRRKTSNMWFLSRKTEYQTKAYLMSHWSVVRLPIHCILSHISYPILYVVVIKYQDDSVIYVHAITYIDSVLLVRGSHIIYIYM